MTDGPRTRRLPGAAHRRVGGDGRRRLVAARRRIPRDDLRRSSTTSPRGTGSSPATSRCATCTSTRRSSPASRSRRGSPNPCTGSCRPRSTHRAHQVPPDPQPWFSPGAVNRIEPRAAGDRRRLIAEIAPLGECDFVRAFALRYPTEVFLTMSDCPGPMPNGWCRGWRTSSGASVATRRARSNGRRPHGDPELLGSGRRRAPERTEPRPGDLASHLLHATIDGEALEETVILDMLQVLVLAGLDTTRGQLGYLFKYLAENPPTGGAWSRSRRSCRQPSRSRCACTQSSR